MNSRTVLIIATVISIVTIITSDYLIGYGAGQKSRIPVMNEQVRDFDTLTALAQRGVKLAEKISKIVDKRDSTIKVLRDSVKTLISKNK
jgi:hypothetical protein